ncbi:MAG: DNA-directed DNA polymerase [Candidatus Micrarchaeaceae archaeon]
MIEIKGIIVDIDSVSTDEGAEIRMFVKGEKGKYTIYDNTFKPYLILLPFNSEIDVERIKGIEIESESKKIKVIGAEERTMRLFGIEKRAIKVYASSPSHIPKLAEALKEFGEIYESDIVFWKRYLIDKDLSPLEGVRILAEEENGRLFVRSIEKLKEELSVELSYLCFDIETYNPLIEPRPKEDPVLLISYATKEEKGVLSIGEIDKEFVKAFKTEKDMLEYFVSFIREKDFDVISGYNSFNFDIPYLVERCKALGIKFAISRYGEEVKKEHHGLVEMVRIPGRCSIDIFQVSKFVATVGTAEYLIKSNNLTLKEVYKAITGKDKVMVNRGEIWKIWDSGKEERERLAEYSLSDSSCLEELYRFFMPLEFEIAKLIGLTMTEACVSTTGQLVEYFIMRSSEKRGEIIPNKPKEKEIEERMKNPIEGAYVKTPDAGIYENIAVFDFRGLYPSIIIAYNIDPSTISSSDEDSYSTPSGLKFRKSPIGTIPMLLQVLINERAEVKKAYKKNPENKALGAKSQALKILANSFYGYLGYARSRWYSRPCASAVTELGRFYIKKTIEESEKSGFRVIYSDTDSIFIIYNEGRKDEAIELMNRINSQLPKGMELELEDFYSRGVFVGKKGSKEGVKKKYALISESGRIKIRGFELVRRDWSNIARDTQRMVLETILKEGDKYKAIDIVKSIIKKLKEGKVDISELVIYTRLRKDVDSYNATAPEVAAVKKAIERGKRKEDLEGMTIGYVITKAGKSISEKAELEEFAKDYDENYYIDHQIIPATLKIIRELGFDEESLSISGSQKRLFGD